MAAINLAVLLSLLPTASPFFLCGLTRAIPVRTFAFRAYRRFLLNVARHPYVLASFATETCKLNSGHIPFVYT